MADDQDRQDWGTEDEFFRTADRFASEIATLGELEGRKRSLPDGDEQRMTLAREIGDRAMSLVGMSRYQVRLLEARRAETTPPAVHRPVHLILADWRDAERRLADARIAFERVGDEAERYRYEHRRATEMRAHDEGP